MSDFYATKMGKQFYEGTMKTIAKEMKRRNDLLEEIIEIMKEGKRDENIKRINDYVRVDEEIFL